MRAIPAAPPVTPPAMVLVWTWAGGGKADVEGRFKLVAMVDESVELDVGLGAEKVELPAASVEKRGMKGGDSAETRALLDGAADGLTFVVVPFTNHTP